MTHPTRARDVVDKKLYPAAREGAIMLPRIFGLPPFRLAVGSPFCFAPLCAPLVWAPPLLLHGVFCSYAAFTN
jgi:hypothetical protein